MARYRATPPAQIHKHPKFSREMTTPPRSGALSIVGTFCPARDLYRRAPQALKGANHVLRNPRHSWHRGMGGLLPWVDLDHGGAGMTSSTALPHATEQAAPPTESSAVPRQGSIWADRVALVFACIGGAFVVLSLALSLRDCATEEAPAKALPTPPQDQYVLTIPSAAPSVEPSTAPRLTEQASSPRSSSPPPSPSRTRAHAPRSTWANHSDVVDPW